MTEQMFRLYRRGDPIFPYVRLCLPAFDLDRHKYGLKHQTLVRVYQEALGLAQNNSFVQKLSRWKNPTVRLENGRHWTNPHPGDFGALLEHVLKQDSRTRELVKVLTISDINAELDLLHSAKDHRQRVAVFTRLLRHATALEHKWLVRIILDDMKLRIRAETFLQKWHPDALELLNRTSSLREVCEQPALRDPRRRLERAGLQPGTPFRPMLCSKKILDGNDAALLKALRGQGFYIEQKMDGERVLMHKRRDKVEFWSRRSKKFDRYGEVFQRVITENVGGPQTEVILDGEMLVWDDDAQIYLPFGNNRTIGIMEERGDAELRKLVFVVFDVVYVSNWRAHPELDGDITMRPLRFRKALMKELVKRVPHRLERIEAKLQDVQKDEDRRAIVIDRLEQAIQQNFEGIVIKRAESEYRCNERKNEWIKIKPEYADGTVRTLDVVIMGAYLARGTRRKGYSHFLIGVAVRSDDEWAPGDDREGPQPSGPMPTRWRTLGKVGSGYCLDELADLQKELDPHFVPLEKDHRDRVIWPPYLEGWSRVRAQDIPDVTIDPKNSVLVEVMAAQVLTSDIFSAGYTLRFPRITPGGIRTDKGVNECEDIRTIRELAARNKGRLVHLPDRTRKAGSGSQSARPRRGGRSQRATQESRERSKPTLHDDFRPTDLSGIAPEFTILRGWEVCVMPQQDGALQRDESLGQFNSKAKLDELLHRLGATVVPLTNPKMTTLTIAATTRQMRVKNLIRSDCDIAKPQWVLACWRRAQAGSTEPPPRVPWRMHHISKPTKELLRGTYTRWGDSYFDDLSVEEHRQLCSTMDRDKVREYLAKLYDEQVLRAAPSTEATSEPGDGEEGGGGAGGGGSGGSAGGSAQWEEAETIDGSDDNTSVVEIDDDSVEEEAEEEAEEGEGDEEAEEAASGAGRSESESRRKRRRRMPSAEAPSSKRVAGEAHEAGRDRNPFRDPLATGAERTLATFRMLDKDDYTRAIAPLRARWYLFLEDEHRRRVTEEGMDEERALLAYFHLPPVPQPPPHAEMEDEDEWRTRRELRRVATRTAIMEYDFSKRGGYITRELEDPVTHFIVMHPDDESWRAVVEDRLAHRDVWVVRANWVTDCMKEGTQLDPTPYILT